MATTLLHQSSTKTCSSARRQIFQSVFPLPTANVDQSLLSTQPDSFFETIHSTPSHGYNTRHHPTPTPDQLHLLPNPVEVQARRSSAWEIVTKFLEFGNETFPTSMLQWLERRKVPGKEELEAIKYMVLSNEDGETNGRGMLAEWYTSEVRRHFLERVRGELEIPKEYNDAAKLLDRILAIANTAQEIYAFQLRNYVLATFEEPSPRKLVRRGRTKKTLDDDDKDPRVRAFTRTLNSLISHSLVDPGWSRLVYTVFLDLCGAAVGMPNTAEGDEDKMSITEDNPEDGDEYGQISARLSQKIDPDGDIIVATDDASVIEPGQLRGNDDSQVSRNRSTPVGGKSHARKKVLELWRLMENLGIGGAGRRGERVFAEVINTLITSYVHQSFAERWEHPSNAEEELTDWVENTLGKLILDVLFSSARKPEGYIPSDKLSPRESLRVTRQSLGKRRKGGMEIDFSYGPDEEEQKRRAEDLESWKRIALGRLGRLRVSELFDIVVDWPQSLGGVEDLKSYITTPQTRLHLTTTFSAALNSRILHPGAGTSHVLAAYIRLIRAFTILDPRGVLLDRVSRSIRRYLRERDDTIRVVVRGIMAETLPPSDPSDPDSDLAELAAELTKGLPSQAVGGLEDMDFEDMSWVPDPIDAGPEYKRNKGLDVVGSLISLWDNKEVWLKEIQSVLASRLLDNPGYDTTSEIRTIELLKLRFGDSLTQACDVMLKDITDSKRADATIRETRPQSQSLDTEFHAKILSRLFWPQSSMKAETVFRVPTEISAAMDQFTAGFEALKSKRKLDWLPALATVEVELELEDRTVHVTDATAAQAAVIHAFDGITSLRGEELMKKLQMSTSVFNPAISFWMEKMVLRESEPGLYTVCERLDKETELDTGHRPGNDGGDEEIDPEKLMERQIIEKFIIGMLTNQGVIQEQRMQMMLTMLVPGGYTWSIDELKEFLVEMKDAGKVMVAPGGWKIVS
ncbi:hypothetical protein EX30DRAFT_315543 [Ascodesmis nigricans]|uniref:Anaphase-promoting complex subunit 2 n=1 Tax=Ascodesmis nigricans TaxID=341454 RepID=A0A4S2N3T8_9PEZI|nr:hypothetical protein EX30DRAFT_315543 [Ascodesmis nigricans]